MSLVVVGILLIPAIDPNVATMTLFSLVFSSFEKAASCCYGLVVLYPAEFTQNES